MARYIIEILFGHRRNSRARVYLKGRPFRNLTPGLKSSTAAEMPNKIPHLVLMRLSQATSLSPHLMLLFLIPCSLLEGAPLVAEAAGRGTDATVLP